MAHLRKLIDSLPFLDLTPDQELITNAHPGGSRVRLCVHLQPDWAHVHRQHGRISGVTVKTYCSIPRTVE
jgi:hypothetical protein